MIIVLQINWLCWRMYIKTAFTSVEMHAINLVYNSKFQNWSAKILFKIEIKIEIK